MSKVSQKGQVTIPVEIREQLGIRPGDEVTFQETDDGYVLRKAPSGDRFDKWHGAIDSEAPMHDRMEELRGRPLRHADDEPDEREADRSDDGSSGSEP